MDVTPVFKKDNSLLAKNYRLLSVLPTVSKIFAKADHQLYKPIPSALLCGYRKDFIAQTTLLYFIEKLKFMLDKKEYVGTILMNLSKAFNTINYELLVAKLNTYGFSKEMIFRYLNNRTQRVKINKTFSSLRKLLYGVLHGSVLGSNLFNIYLNYLFLFLNEIDGCTFDNNTTPSMCYKNLAEIYKENLKETLNKPSTGLETIK